MLRSTTCPRRLVSEDSGQWIGMHAQYRAGFLPFAGGSLDQPNAFVEAMNLIDQWVDKDAG